MPKIVESALKRPHTKLRSGQFISCSSHWTWEPKLPHQNDTPCGWKRAKYINAEIHYANTMWRKLVYSGFGTCFGPSTLGEALPYVHDRSHYLQVHDRSNVLGAWKYTPRRTDVTAIWSMIFTSTNCFTLMFVPWPANAMRRKLLHCGFETCFVPQHVGCWGQNTSQILILRHFEQKGSDAIIWDWVAVGVDMW